MGASVVVFRVSTVVEELIRSQSNPKVGSTQNLNVREYLDKDIQWGSSHRKDKSLDFENSLGCKHPSRALHVDTALYIASRTLS